MELSRRGQIQGSAIRTNGRFPLGLSDLPGESTLFCPGFMSILSWLDIAQALGHRVVYDVPWNPFLLPCNDPRYLLWGDDESFMQTYIEVLGLDWTAAQLLSEAEARRWELRATLGRVDQVVAPTPTLAEQFHADLLPDFVWEEEFDKPLDGSSDRSVKVVWRGEAWELTGLREFWQSTLEAVRECSTASFFCYGPLSEWFVRMAKSEGVQVTFDSQIKPPSFLADLILTMHPKGIFYEGLSSVSVMQGVFAARGHATLLGAGPVVEPFIDQYGGIKAGRGDWTETLVSLIGDEARRQQNRPIMPTGYSEAEGLEILLV